MLRKGDIVTLKKELVINGRVVSPKEEFRIIERDWLLSLLYRKSIYDIVHQQDETFFITEIEESLLTKC